MELLETFEQSIRIDPSIRAAEFAVVVGQVLAQEGRCRLAGRTWLTSKCGINNRKQES